MIVSPTHLAPGCPADHDEPVEVGPHEQRLVVQHLLEVRHEPFAIDGVAGEAAAQVVVHPARCHRVECGGDDVAGRIGRRGHVRPQHQLEVERRRELRRLAETTPVRVEGAPESLHGLVEVGDVGQIIGRFDRRGRVDRLHEGRDVLAQLGGLVAVRVVDRAHEGQELRLGEVRAAVEGLAVGRDEHGHRPASPAGHRLHGIHVHGVDVGPLLTIDLHVDEQLVHPGRHLDVLEALVRHHVAPVARRVADRQQDRHVALSGGGERIGAPRIPVDRVVAVLTEIRRGLVSESVHVDRGYRQV